MKTKYILVPSLAAALAFAGCQEIDTFQEGDMVTSDQKEEIIGLDPSKAEAGVNAIFSRFSQYMPNKGALGASRHNDIGYPTIMLCTDANGMDMISDNNGYNWTGFNLSFEDRLATSRECQMVWNDLYGLIYSANNVVATMSGEAELPASSQKFLGQALSVRAFGYFILAQLFQFNYVGHQSSPCVPLILDTNSEEAAQNGMDRATVEAVYTQILADLDRSIELLTAAEAEGETRKDRRYTNASVVYGLRARVNLTMQNWKAAADDATKAIELSDAAPASIADMSKPAFWNMTEGNWMWGIKVEETDEVVSSGIVNWISHMGSLNYGYANYSGGMQINKKLYGTIADTDVRKGWWLNADATSVNLTTADQKAWMKDYGYKPYTQVKFAPYNNVVGQSINANDIPLMRIEEMYLIKAEGEAMGGDPAAGKSTLVDFVKAYRDPSYAFSGASAADLQEEIFRQRRIELWGEGLSWYDIMRLNKPVDRRGAGYPNAPMVFNISAGSDILLWRIPEKEILANKALDESKNNPSAPLPTPVDDVE